MATNLVFAKFPENLGGGNNASEDTNIDILSDTIKQTLHTSTWTPNQSTDETKTNATNELSTANGYTAGGVTLGTKLWSASSLVTTFDAADTSWTLTGSITFRHGPIWDDTPTNIADPLICNIDTGGDQTLNGITFAMQFNASGILTITVS